MKFSDFLHLKAGMLRKLWINQFAFSLFGLFVASALSGPLCVVAGVFSLLFYLSVVGFAILDDAQKDRITKQAGRGAGFSAWFGLQYTALAFLPTFLLTLGYSIYSFFSKTAGALQTIWFVLVKYAFAGEILGIDVGWTAYTYDAVNQVRTSAAPLAVQFMSEHALFQLLFTVLVPLVLGLVYSLAFSGKISFNTTDSKKK